MVQFDLFGEVEKKLETRAEQRKTEAAKPRLVAHRKVYAAPGDPNQHAFSIAENVIDAWHSHYGGSRMEIPLGTVAALSFFREPLVGDWLRTLEPSQFLPLLREIWGVQWYHRPDLIECARPLHDWVEEEPDDQQLRAVQAVVHAAVNTGLLDLTGHNDPYIRTGADILSPLLTGLRHKSDKRWRGEYHTPPCVSDLMARILFDGDRGLSIREPAIGSGGMFRSVAHLLHELNLNPYDYTWIGNDIDRLSAACAAVNAIYWDLGPQVAIWCGNTFEANGLTKALAERTAIIEHRNNTVGGARMVALIRHVDRLLEGVAA
ncbi:N-6 DNA methylase [Streptomyces sp. NPDC057909]|uniref:N-6 DNA methylase n=1 Tax=Streptomyces sp. NPDC057909 TaxID=3346277 RepID=UPI0036F06506